MPTVMINSATRLHGDEIDNVARALRLACCEGRIDGASCSYLGVWPADQLPKAASFCSFTKRRGACCCYGMKCFIANTDPARLPGHHWVEFVSYAHRPAVVEFFDSYGYPISHYKHLAEGCEKAGYFNNTYTILGVNPRTLQHANSVVCGHYCLLYIYLCARVNNNPTRLMTAMQVLVRLLAERGDNAGDRDEQVWRVLRELLRRSDTLSPVLHCSLQVRRAQAMLHAAVSIKSRARSFVSIGDEIKR
jgi:hypothetical protein